MDELLAAAERLRAKLHADAEIVEHVRRYLEVAAADIDQGRREMAAELSAIVGVPD